MGFKAGDYPQAEQYYAEAISLPMYQTLSDEQQDQVMQVLQMVLRS
jgi:dTDP-4-amino-4,6-dideoxygalactose transaminase